MFNITGLFKVYIIYFSDATLIYLCKPDYSTIQHSKVPRVDIDYYVGPCTSKLILICRHILISFKIKDKVF